jgi:hypothetical protein
MRPGRATETPARPDRGRTTHHAHQGCLEAYHTASTLHRQTRAIAKLSRERDRLADGTNQKAMAYNRHLARRGIGQMVGLYR